MIRMIREGALVAIATFLALALTGRPAAGAAERSPLDREGEQQETRDTRGAAIAAARRTQEQWLRGAYLKLMRYQRAYREQSESAERNAGAGAQDRPAGELQLELGRVRTGRIDEILKRPLGELATAGTGRLLRSQPIVYKLREGPEHLAYRAELYDAPETDEWKGWDGMTVADQLRKIGPAAERAEMYTAYEVSLTLGGERRGYRAFAVYTPSGPDDTIAIVDNVIGARTASDLLTAEFPPVRAPWVRYVRSPTYAAVARQIEEARRAGRSPIPAGAPAGTLAGDGVAPDPPARRSRRGAAKTQPVVCVPITVGALIAELPATGQPQVTGRVVDSNPSRAFGDDATPSFISLFQGDVQMTVTATAVQPSQAEASLRWKLERDPRDTVGIDLPALDATAGPQVRVTPRTAGNFHLICYSDTNHNDQYDAGEELRVLRFAVVRGTVPSGQCTLDSGGVGFITASELNPGEMALAMNPNLTLPGMNLECFVVLEGGGAHRTIGTGSVQLGDVGNLKKTTAQVVYAPAPGASAPLGYEKPVVEPPMLDARGPVGTGGDTAFRSFEDPPTPAPGPGGNGTSFEVRGFDLPGAGPWQISHPTAHTTWATTQGGYDFRDFVAAYPKAFPKTYFVFAAGNWAVRVVGRNNNGTWTNTGSSITLQNQPPPTANMTVTVTGASPQSGDAAGMQVLGPTYALRANREFQYTLANLAAPTLGGTAGNALATLTWNAPGGAKTYNLRRGTTSGGPYQDVALGLKTTTYTNTGLTNGTQYFFVVTAADGALESPNSNEKLLKPMSGAIQPPAAPKNVTATRGTNQVTVAWSPADGADSYRIKRATSGNGPFVSILDGWTGTSYINTGLTKGTTYYYVVSAVNSAGESPNSTPPASATP